MTTESVVQCNTTSIWFQLGGDAVGRPTLNVAGIFSAEVRAPERMHA